MIWRSESVSRTLGRWLPAHEESEKNETDPSRLTGSVGSSGGARGGAGGVPCSVRVSFDALASPTYNLRAT